MWLNPQSLRRWMCPGATTVVYLVLDPFVGGEFEIDMQTPEGQHYLHTGKYLEINRPERLKFTWHSPVLGDKPSQVTVEFQEQPGGCLVVLTHELLSDQETLDGHIAGWQEVLEKYALTINY
jgi:uncharacterized protein YndB with AHSA1/START domain